MSQLTLREYAKSEYIELIQEQIGLAFVREKAPFIANHLRVELREDHRIQRQIVTLVSSMLRDATTHNHTETRELPATWWEMLKDSHAPDWFKRRFPVKMRTLSFVFEKITRVCPHADFEWGHNSHYGFLTFDPIREHSVSEE